MIYAKRNVRALFLLCVLWLTACETLTGTKVTRPIRLESAAEGFAIEQFAQLQPPARGGFGVDNSLILSAPVFNALRPQYDANVIRPMADDNITTAQATSGFAGGNGAAKRS